MKYAIASLLALFVGLGVGYVAFNTSPPAEPAEPELSTEAAAENDAALEKLRNEVASANRRADQATRKLDDVSKELGDLKTQVADAAAAAAAAADSAAPGAGAEEVPAGEEWREELAGGPPLDFPEFDEALSGVDWVVMAETMHTMVGAIKNVAEVQSRGEEPPMEMYIAIQTNNSKLVTEYMKLRGHDVPGSQVNGSFTHVSVLANAIVATLAAAGEPATDEQTKSIHEAGRDHVERDQRRIAAYGEQALGVKKRADEAELKRSFLDAAFAVLTPKQVETLAPEFTRGRVRADIFSEGLIWVGNVKGLGFDGPEDLASQAATQVASAMSLKDDTHEALSGITSDWAAGLPAEVLDQRRDELDKMGLVKAEKVTLSARHTAVLLKAVLNGLNLDEETRTRLIEQEAAFFLYRNDTE